MKFFRTLVEARPGQGEEAIFVRANKNPDFDPAAIVGIPMLGWRTWREAGSDQLVVEARVANSVDPVTGLPNGSIHDLLPNGDVVDTTDGSFLGYGWRGEWKREDFIEKARAAHVKWLEFRLAAAEQLGSAKDARVAQKLLNLVRADQRHLRNVERVIVAGRRAERRAKPKKALGKRFRVLERCGFKCVYCGRPASEVSLQIDHVIPRAKGGSDDESNLVAACWDCNGGKSDRLLVVLP